MKELLDIAACGVIPVNGNHRPQMYPLRGVVRCAMIPVIVTRPQEVRPMKAVSVMGAPSQPTITRLN